MNLVELIFGAVFCLMIQAFYSGSEIALLSADKIKLRMAAQKKGNPGSRHARTYELVKVPGKILSTTLVMTNFSMVCLSVLITLYFTQSHTTHSELLAVLITSPLVVLFGELLPKTFFRKNADKFAPYIGPIVDNTFKLLGPVTGILARYTLRLSRFVGPIEELITGKRRTTRDDIRSLLSIPKKSSEIKLSEKRIIKRIFDFTDTEAQHALIPLVRVQAVDQTTTVEEALQSFLKHRHSRMPVFEDRIDNIIGVIEARTLLSATDLTDPLTKYMVPARYVAETQALEDVLSDMRQRDDHLVVIVDEHGGAVGILTFEDIIEEIVGEIDDEYDPEESPIRNPDKGKWSVSAHVEISKLNEETKIEVPEGAYDTLSGFLIQQFGRIPNVGDELFFNTPSGEYRFLIKNASERTILKVEIFLMSERE